MLIVLLVVILALAVVSLFSERLPESYHKYILWGTIIVLFIVCVTRPKSYASDFLNYEGYFYAFDKLKTKLLVEPTFLWLSGIVYRAGGTVHAVLFLYAMISLPLKLYTVRKLTNETVFILVVIVYASHYFMLHDCEQIRIAAALSFGMYAFYMKVRDNYWWIAFVLIGISFHHTLAALFVPLLFSPRNLTKAWKVGLCVLVPVSILLWLMHINIISALPIPYIETRLKLYEMAIANGKHPDVRVINAMVLLRIALFYYIMYYYDTIKAYIKGLPLLLVCDALSIASWFALATMSVIAVRISQLYGVIEIILFASVYYTLNPKWVGKCIVVLIALYFFAQNYISNQFGFR